MRTIFVGLLYIFTLAKMSLQILNLCSCYFLYEKYGNILVLQKAFFNFPYNNLFLHIFGPIEVNPILPKNMGGPRGKGGGSYF